MRQRNDADLGVAQVVCGEMGGRGEAVRKLHPKGRGSRRGLAKLAGKRVGHDRSHQSKVRKEQDFRRKNLGNNRVNIR